MITSLYPHGGVKPNIYCILKTVPVTIFISDRRGIDNQSRYFNVCIRMWLFFFNESINLCLWTSDTFTEAFGMCSADLDSVQSSVRLGCVREQQCLWCCKFLKRLRCQKQCFDCKGWKSKFGLWALGNNSVILNNFFLYVFNPGYMLYYIHSSWILAYQQHYLDRFTFETVDTCWIFFFLLFYRLGHTLTSEAAEGSRLHYYYYNLGWESSHIYQTPCLRRGAHCLYKSNAATAGHGGGRPGGARWWEDLALRSCIYTDSALQSAAVCWELTVHRSFQMLPLIAWPAWILRRATVIRFVYRHDITIDLLASTWAPLLLCQTLRDESTRPHDVRACCS